MTLPMKRCLAVLGLVFISLVIAHDARAQPQPQAQPQPRPPQARTAPKTTPTTTPRKASTSNVDPEIERLRRANAELEARVKAAQADNRAYAAKERHAKARDIRIAGWTLLGVGLTAVVVAAVLGGVSTYKTHQIEDLPTGTPWNDASDAYTLARDTRTGFWVCTSVALAALATGTTLLLWRRFHKRAERVTIAPTPTRGGGLVTLGGRF